MRINVNDLHNERLKQIEIELKKEYFKGKRRSRAKIAKLLQEKERINKLL